MPLTPTQKRNWRSALANYYARAEKNRLAWHYSQTRPYHGLGVVPEGQHVGDCSSYAATGFYWAGSKTQVHVSDPLNLHYSGWGFTGTSIDFVKAHPAPPGKYLIGDLAFFGANADNTVHMSICRKAGDRNTAIFSSHGHQSWIFGQDAPEPISLATEAVQQHLIGVYRHPALL